MNPVETALLENIDNPNFLFIFPTDIAASQWADHILRLKGGVKNDGFQVTISMNNFLAWDIFKQNSIKSKVQSKKSIPSALRKIFVSRLIQENAEAVKNGKDAVFTSLIRVQWAQQASQFSSWLTGILPQLGAWFNKITGREINSILGVKTAMTLEGDDMDMYTLARRYAQFLEENNLFEPAWETPPFNNEGKNVFIFFPESLSDYSEYSQLLTQSKHVKTISVPDTINHNCDTFFYTNSRSEITEASLYIRALHEKQEIPWDSIAVCIPDNEYEPYVLREFTNRNIPWIKRTSKPLADYPAGKFFKSLLECTSQDFSFSSVVSLIRNKYLPWKENQSIDNLIQFGIKNNCLFSWVEEKNGREQKINVWEDAFDKPFEYYDKDTAGFFYKLKKYTASFRNAQSFGELRRQYFIFREQFFDMENCSEETDLILSRCICELMNLVELEKTFPHIPAVDPFLFFTEYVSEVYYLPQTKLSGVSILPYKTAAAAPFDCHVILGAGQESLSVVYSQLDFLPRKKREDLGIKDEDASVSFIDMHKFNSIKNSAFFCCEKTFSGFAIPHSKINPPAEPEERYSTLPEFINKFSRDYYKAEKEFLSGADTSEALKLHENQINGFTEWKRRRLSSCEHSDDNAGAKWNNCEEIQKKIANNNKYNVSATSLQKYFQCSMKWLFESVFRLENTQIETTLMAENISGLVYHAILNNFFTEIKNEKQPLEKPVYSDSGLSLSDSYHDLLEKNINKVFNYFPSMESNGVSRMSALTSRLLYAGKKEFLYHLEKSLAYFLSFFAGYSIFGTENYYTSQQDSYIMKGFIDCILKDDTDKYVIVDFKLKHMPARSDCTGIVSDSSSDNNLADFQLPVYITLAEENEKFKVYTALFYSILDLRPEVIIGTIQDINNKKIIPGRAEDQIIINTEQYKKIFENLKNKTEQFVKEISTGDFTVFAQKASDCQDCDFQRICRTVYIIDCEVNLLGKH